MMRAGVQLGECSTFEERRAGHGTAGLRRGHSGQTTASGKRCRRAVVSRNLREMTIRSGPCVHYRTSQASQERRCDR